MDTYTPAEITEMILRDGERVLARKHGRPAPRWPKTAGTPGGAPCILCGAQAHNVNYGLMAYCIPGTFICVDRTACWVRWDAANMKANQEWEADND